MRPVLAGLLCSGVILAPVVVYAIVRVVQFSRENTYVWGSVHWTVRRAETCIASGDRYSREDFSNLDYIARECLAEWFDSESGERALVHDSHHARYSCTVQYQGRVGQAWG